MLTFALPALLVLAMSGTWLWLRFHPASWRMAGTVVACAGLGFALFQANVSPLLTSPGVPIGPAGHWLRAVGIFWWLCSARLLAQLARWLLSRDEGTRHARIAGDLVSGMIYLATFLVVLNFVLLLPVGGGGWWQRRHGYVFKYAEPQLCAGVTHLDPLPAQERRSIFGIDAVQHKTYQPTFSIR
jgi:hypothetical protein